MALFNQATREVTAKLVYYGPAAAGKATNVQWLQDHAAFRTKGRLVSLETPSERTLFFEFQPLAEHPLAELRARVQVHAVTGTVAQEASRRALLKGCDAVVFVADSEATRLDENAESLSSLRQNLLANDVDPSIPLVIQYNKRDLATALPLETLNARLNPQGAPFREAAAAQGLGVAETLDDVTRLLFQWLSGSRGAAATPGPQAPANGRLATTTSEPPRGDGVGPGQWLYLVDGTQHGPVGLEDLIDLVLSSLPEDTRVWRAGLAGFVRARDVREIADEIPPPLPAPAAPRLEEEMPDFYTVPPLLRTALIADEDAAFRKVLAMPLAAQGFTIHEAADGARAWELALQHRPWLILADISMPEVDGFEFCRRVRSHALLSRKLVLFVSGSDKYKERYRALRIGADDFLSKSLPIRELLMRIQLFMTRYSDLHFPSGWKPGASSGEGALEGRLEVFGAPALLQMCNQGRLTGTLSAGTAQTESDTATLAFREGEIVSALAGAKLGAEAVYEFLGWDKGGFRFTAGDPGPGTPLAESVEALLLEGCRRLDELRRPGDAPA